MHNRNLRRLHPTDATPINRFHRTHHSSLRLHIKSTRRLIKKLREEQKDRNITFHKVRRFANPIDQKTKTLTNLHRRCVCPQFSSFRFRTSGGNWN
ncbi:hypothetical protein L1987_45738 [Smallanthus sonchifolius]|uniref:Uncharacterized protein n=1 Tax=Smallanthus sonchifolius TaxID=185202 RepID=A0ACB9FYE7_9ASTR|nr:hypothetical protein L1987_45738 [Smallanthus sonchifolius]